MQHIVQLLGIAIIAFISINIDDFFVLAAFFLIIHIIRKQL
ncbi:hypothetical protein JQ038_14940 [Clostridium botulinum]|nr:hypothetical protein [Clostridium botulinum]MCS4472620.1 hypothetical protein [Clostridium botulinum]MCS4483273.1 hypothetical protein [Clostridium botulinum]